MSGSSSDDTKAVSNLPSVNRDYEVGYGKPPVQTRFKKGRSGNPRGRPKGAKNKLPAYSEERLKTILLEEAYRDIPINEGGKTITIPMAQAVVRSVAVNAAKGNSRAQRLFTELLATTESDRKREHDALVEAAINYKVEWDIEFARCRNLGLPEPDILPHPDDVIINLRANTVEFVGPMTREEQAERQVWIDRKALFLEERAELLQQLKDPADEHHRQHLETELARTDQVLDIVRQMAPDRPTERAVRKESG